MVFKKIIFQNRYVALETPSRHPPFMAKTILNFHFDYLTPSLSQCVGPLSHDGGRGGDGDGLYLGLGAGWSNCDRRLASWIIHRAKAKAMSRVEELHLFKCPLQTKILP